MYKTAREKGHYICVCIYVFSNYLQSLEAKELTHTIQRHVEKIRDMELVVMGMRKELQEAKEELIHAQESHNLKEKHLQASKELAEKELTKVKKQLDSVQAELRPSTASPADARE